MRILGFLLLACTSLSGCVSDREIYADYGELDCPQACPDVMTFFWPSVVNFDFDKHNLTENEQSRLEQAVTVLEGNPSFKIAVIGSTDQKGSDEYNRVLSIKRSTVVAEFLKNKGIASSRISMIATGERELFVQTEDDGVNRANRRTHLILLDENYNPVDLYFDKLVSPLGSKFMNKVNSL